MCLNLKFLFLRFYKPYFQSCLLWERIHCMNSDTKSISELIQMDCRDCGFSPVCAILDKKKNSVHLFSPIRSVLPLSVHFEVF